MTIADINIAPGLYTIDTDRGAVSRWKDGNHVRFKQGLPQKIGGWAVSGSTTFTGKARGVVDWQSLAVERIIGLGTHLKLYAWIGSTYTDITPLRESGTLGNNPFDMTNTSTTVTVNDVAHGNLVGDYVHFAGATAAGGITVDGEYTVVTIPNADSYTITHSAAATSTTSGGGAAVTYQYEISVGSENSVVGLGWGAGAWNASTWGTARLVSNFLAMARIWSLDNWGEDMIACPRSGGIYRWDTSVGVGTRAAVISGAPTTAKAIMVSTENRHLIALGAYDGAADDPLLIRWCDSEDYTSWTASATNTAGDKRLDSGNEIYCGVKTAKEHLIFTDAAVYSMTFDGPPYTFGFDSLGPNGGLAGPNAAKEMDGRVFWMGNGQFYVYDGSIKVLACDVLNHVFDDINWVQRAKVFAGANRKFNEIWWLYCTEDATECDVYVIYNTVENHWSYGTLARTIFVGDSDTFTTPYAAGTNGYLYDHEFGTDDDTDAMSTSLESGDIDIGDGEYMMQVKKAYPDFATLTGSVSLTLNAKEYPGSSQTLSSTAATITSSTKYANPKVRGRQVSISLATSALSDHWRMGTLRLDIVPHGKK